MEAGTPSGRLQLLPRRGYRRRRADLGQTMLRIVAVVLRSLLRLAVTPDAWLGEITLEKWLAQQ